ncbi:MAG: protein translocase subunit SecD [Candidatus Competibacteraceae bacterium]|jgi:preprotein translocase subunit SecD|nr:protein translocase subunit SecD [Candidatus Competibacteraceae bacterium]
MLNQYEWWKYLIIGLVVVIGLIYALPNVFGEDPAVQISASRASVTVDQALHQRVISALERENVAYKRLELDTDQGRLLVRFADTEVQLKAADVVKTALGRDYVVALNLAPSTPGFMQALGLQPMYLGLDLRGGVHFLMEVDMDAVLAQAEESYVEEIRTLLRNEKVRYTTVTRDSGNPGVVVAFNDPAERVKAEDVLNSELPNLQLSEADNSDLRLTLSEQEIDEKRQLALQQNLTTLRNRVNELGVAEPIIQRQGDNRIVVQLPGVQDTARAKEIIGATATLEFRLVYEGGDPMQAAATGRAPVSARLYRERNGQPILLQRRVMLTGDYIVDAASGLDQQSGGPAVFITLDGKGANRFEDATKDNIGKLMAVVYIENKTETRQVNGESERVSFTVEEVINVATIRDRLGRRFQITGLDSTQEARNLALLLRAGSLAAPIEIIEERTVGPSAGRENIDQGFRSATIAFLLTLGFMSFYYRRFGMVSGAALITNVILIIAALSLLQATLTLPGIAGIILTMGMAVDANVLIFERIREELKVGNSPQAAIHTGFDKAFSTILDANVTTLIAAIVLFGFGTGPIKGFAVTLSLGILTSMFTAIMGARGIINYFYGGRRLETLPI